MTKEEEIKKLKKELEELKSDPAVKNYPIGEPLPLDSGKKVDKIVEIKKRIKQLGGDYDE